jgi:hypothetical protein
VLGVACFLFLYRLADRDLWSSHEARAAMDGQSVLDGSALPRLLDGRPELQKPPLYYWLVAGVARLRGGAVDAWAVRLPAAGSALLAVAAVLGLGWGCRRPLAGLLAGLILSTAGHFTWLARIGRIDMPLTLSATVAGAAFYLARKRPALLLVAYLSVAVGVLLKGPIGLVLPAAVAAGRLLLEGEWPAFWEARAWARRARELGLWWGLPLVLALTVPCFWWAQAASDGRFLREFLWHHNVERGLNVEAGGSGRHWDHPWWLYGPYFVVYFLPWSPLFFLAVCRRGWRGDPEARFGLAWALAVVALLSCARFKRADYLLPAYPGAAFFLGCCLERRLLAASPRRLRAVLLGCTLAVAALTVAYRAWQVEWDLPAREPQRDYRRFAARVRREVPRPSPVTFFRTEAHALAFHLGKPVEVVVAWEQLRDRLGRPGRHYVVMPSRWLEGCRARLAGLCLEVVAHNTDFSGGKHERPLVLLRGGPRGVEKQSLSRQSVRRQARSKDARLRTGDTKDAHSQGWEGRNASGPAAAADRNGAAQRGATGPRHRRRVRRPRRLAGLPRRPGPGV